MTAYSTPKSLLSATMIYCLCLMLKHDGTAGFLSFCFCLFTPPFVVLAASHVAVGYVVLLLCCFALGAEFLAPDLSARRLLSGAGLQDLGLRGFFFSMLCGDCCVLCLCCLVLAFWVFVCVDFGAPRSVVACLCLAFWRRWLVW